jgi:8-oxo-dGTP diphosphatase
MVSEHRSGEKSCRICFAPFQQAAMSVPVSIPVVCALIERNGLLLLAQRPAHKHLPLKWEFPGGKVEPGETPANAIMREIHEELGCQVIVCRALPTFLHDYSTVIIEMIPFVCALALHSPEPTPTEHVGLVWVRPEELTRYDLAAADLPVVMSYLDCSRGR